MSLIDSTEAKHLSVVISTTCISSENIDYFQRSRKFQKKNLSDHVSYNIVQIYMFELLRPSRFIQKYFVFSL